MHSTIRTPAKFPEPDWQPDRLRVWIGGFDAPDTLVEYKAKVIVLECRGFGDEADNGVWITAPKKRTWEAFWRRLEAAGAWKWRRGYADPNVMDGAQWEVEIEYQGRRIRSTGSNGYPAQWRGFLKAVQLLTKRTIK